MSRVVIFNPPNSISATGGVAAAILAAFTLLVINLTYEVCKDAKKPKGSR